MQHLRNVRGFFSDYYWSSLFGRGPQGPSERDVRFRFSRFRRLCERGETASPNAAATRERFVRPLLRDVLGFHLGAGENGIHRLFASAAAEEEGTNPLLLAYCGSCKDEENLDDSHGPMRTLGEALARENVAYGFLVTGNRIRLVRAPGDGPRGAYLEADLEGLAESEDPASFAAFLRLFSASTFRPDPNGQLPIEEIERESRAHAERVSEDLKRAVFRAAEAMVSGLIADAAARGEIASGLELDEARLRAYRDAALLALYRILFVFYAEARDTRLSEHQLYWKSYSATGVLEEVLSLHPSRLFPADWPENRSFLWHRLRALVRIYDRGLPAITPWDHIPPARGKLFSSTTAEGEILDRARLSDRQVAQLILDLATTAPQRGLGRQRVSFRELDIESLGAVYEGLLEYEPRVVREVSLAVRIQGREYVLSPAELVRLCEQKKMRLVGELALVVGTEAERLHPDPTVNQIEDADEQAGEPAGTVGSPEAEGEQAAEDEAVGRGASAVLVRRLEPGTFHFVPGPGRKGSGSFYTPRALVQDLVCHALGPLIEGKKAAEIERLRVLDAACGSGHFLVEAMRYLGRALHRAYVEEYDGKPPTEFRSTTGQGWDIDWRASDEEARAANSEARAWCKRRIAERCLFGVDLNPTAVQLAQVALWIESLAGDRPLTYFEHHIRCGNSLLGTRMDRLEQPPLPDRHSSWRQLPLALQQPLRDAIRQAAQLRRFIDEVVPEQLFQQGVEPESTEEQQFKENMRRQAENTLAAAKLLFDLRSASAFVPEIWGEWEILTSRFGAPEELRAYAQTRPWWPRFEKVRAGERFFHWELEFPEVFVDAERPGFDAVLGNPPWDKIKPDRKEFYGRYDILIRAYVGGELDRRIRELHDAHPDLEAEFKAYEARVKTLAACLKKGGDYRFCDWEVDGKRTGGDPDAFKFFLERAWQLVRDGGRVGFVVPSAIYNNEGCTGLRHLLLEEAEVERFYAFENRRKIFPIHSSYKFVSLVFRKGKPQSEGFEAAFMRHDLAELEATARHRDVGAALVAAQIAPWMVPIRRRELERLSPGTLAFLEYRSPRDREILLKMYGYDAEGNPVNPRPLLGDQGPGTWNARFYTEFHMTNDRDLWTDPETGKLYNPRQILGPIPGTTSEPPYYDPAAWPEIRERMAEAGFWPLYEGKHIHMWVLGMQPVLRWVRLDLADGRTPVVGRRDRAVVRRIAAATDERTLICAVLDPQCFSNDQLVVVESQQASPATIATHLGSLVVDFAVRPRVMRHVDQHIIKMAPSCPVAPVPELATSTFMPRQNHPFDDRARWGPIWLANRAVAEAYGLTPDDFEYVLSTFPVFARKRPGFYAYLQARVQEWKREVEGAKIYAMPGAALARAAETAEVYVTEPSRQPAASPAFQQAAVLAWVVHKLHSPGYPVSRFRVQKMLYLIEAATETGLFTEFHEQAAGPYDPGLRYKGPEDIAMRQRGWLVARGDTHFEPGPHIEEALRYAARYIDTEFAELVLEEFRTFKDETLERWTTVHLAAVELERRGELVTPETVSAYIQSVPEWQPKLSREEFALGRIADALEGLRRTDLCLATAGKMR